jgi:hypothetical protein
MEPTKPIQVNDRVVIRSERSIWDQCRGTAQVRIVQPPGWMVKVDGRRNRMYVADGDLVKLE